MVAPVGTWAAAQVRGQVIGKDLEGTPGHGHRPVGVSTRTSSIHLVESPAQAVHHVRVTLPTRHTGEVVGNGGEPIDARPALAGTLPAA